MADRIAVMSGGVLQQYDTPDVIYNQPANIFVAGFVGSPAMNLLPVRAVTSGDAVILESADGWRVPLSPNNARRVLANPSQDLVVGVRHNNVVIRRQEQADTIPGRVYTIEPTGDLTYVHILLGEQIIVASTDPDFHAVADDTIWVTFDQSRLHLFDAQTEQALPALDGAPVRQGQTASSPV
jgi:multiple sugar transport system ATP-binding protein